LRVLITGGAGFVGSSLAVALAERHRDWDIVTFDNVRRRGSELNLSRLRDAGTRFVHGDVREADDLAALEGLHAIVECSAEPSALAGVDGATAYVVHTNLVGAYNVLELARRCAAQLVFLSTSRVYPIAALRSLAIRETETRFELEEAQELPGVSSLGVSEAFPLDGARTLYGATKLAAELLTTEYASSFGIATVVNRCGVIAGPWQMATSEQGVFAHWLVSHYFGRELRYLGFGGSGKQVRDLLHVDDVVDLVEDQLQRPGHWQGRTFNVGGGRERSLSLLETTELCRELTGNRPEVSGSAEERSGDVPVYISDCERLLAHTDWRPRRTPRQVLEDVFAWVRENESALHSTLQ